MALRQFARVSAPLFRLQSASPLLSTSFSRSYSTGEGSAGKRGVFFVFCHPKNLSQPLFFSSCVVWHFLSWTGVKIHERWNERASIRTLHIVKHYVSCFFIMMGMVSDRLRLDRATSVPFSIRTLFFFFCPIFVSLLLVIEGLKYMQSHEVSYEKH